MIRSFFDPDKNFPEQIQRLPPSRHVLVTRHLPNYENPSVKIFRVFFILKREGMKENLNMFFFKNYESMVWPFLPIYYFRKKLELKPKQVSYKSEILQRPPLNWITDNRISRLFLSYIVCHIVQKQF